MRFGWYIISSGVFLNMCAANAYLITKDKAILNIFLLRDSPVIGKSLTSRVRMPRFKSQLCYLLACDSKQVTESFCALVSLSVKQR